MTMQQQWNDLCGRMGVQPKQFGGLLAVLVVAVGVLGAKFSFGPSKASAGTDLSAKTTQSAPKQATKPQPGVKAQASKPAKRTVVKAELSQTCERDPFRMWMLPEAVTTPASPAVATVSPVATPGALPGLPLKAVVRGELAVFGDQTARAGDAIVLPDGSFAEVKSIGDRVVTVVWDGRTFDVRFGGSGSPSRAPAAGGFK